MSIDVNYNLFVELYCISQLCIAPNTNINVIYNLFVMLVFKLDLI